MSKQLSWSASISGKEIREMLASPDHWLESALSGIANAVYANAKLREIWLSKLDALKAMEDGDAQ